MPKGSLEDNLKPEYITFEEVKKYIDREYIKMEYISKDHIGRMAKKESSLNIFAVGKKVKGLRGRGLFQIQKPTWEEVNPSVFYEMEVFNPLENTKTAVKYLKDLSYKVKEMNPKWESSTKEERTAYILAAFDYGIGNLEDNSWDLLQSPKETKEYIEFVSGYKIS